MITHELVHARQVHTQWLAWQRLAEPRQPWMKFMEPYSLRERVQGPQELEAYATGLDFIARLNRAERRQVLRGLFVSFARTLKELAPIARKGYADPKLRPFYDDFLADLGLTFSAVLGPPDAGP